MPEFLTSSTDWHGGMLVFARCWRENSHQPTRQRERAMKGFRTPGGAQRFLSVFGVISPHFRPRRHRLTATDYRTEIARRFTVWNEVTGLTAAA